MGTACALSCGKMGVGHVLELCCAFGSMHVGGPSVLTKRKEGGKDLCAAKAVPQRLEKSVRVETQSIQMEYAWLYLAHIRFCS